MFVWQVYYSTTELHDPEDLSDMDAELIADHNDIVMEDLNGQPPNNTDKVSYMNNILLSMF